MPRIAYIQKRFNAKSAARIQQANAIITEYQEQGFDLTLRQLYYQFVSRDLLPNTEKSYDSLGALISDARLAGLIDWNVIHDRTRNLKENAHWDGPDSIVEACASQFRVDLWENQTYRPECWIEKDALVGVIEGVCRKLDVPYFSCRGYTSQSEMWRAGRRMKQYISGGQTPIVIHLGDHDPSGIDMSRDIQERLSMFAEDEIAFRRIALNMDQVREYEPPPNPAKVTDARFESYARNYGDESWELDALEPKVLSALVQKEVTGLIATKAWKAAAERQEEAREQLTKVSDNWDTVIERLAA
jgi:hypothetical protein